jgi:glycosyltransferase involved in cell wall biosynthesis
VANSFSAIVLMQNHRQHVGPCLRSLAWADEIVMVNDGSTDGSLDIARTFPRVRILDRPLAEDWAAQMNWGMAHAGEDWRLHLDVDERVPPDLVPAIRDLAARPEINGIAFRILGSFLGTLMGDRTPYATRMVRRQCGEFEDRRVHAALHVRGRVARAQGMLVHLGPFPTVESFWSKNIRYARVEARGNLEHGERLVGNSVDSYILHFLAKPAGVFLQKYFLEGHWRHGVTGLHFALLRAIGYYMVYLATWERQRGEHDELRQYCQDHGIPYLDDSTCPLPGRAGQDAPHAG